MTDIREILDLYDRLVAACVDVVPTDALERAAETGRAARRRVGYLGDTVVVALAGGTGTGKSSLLNALAGEEVSPPGAQRPTTSDPVAWIPASPEGGLTRLLDDIGIEQRVGQDSHPWLALIDLPDTDSVVVDHRQTVERILPLVDAVVWVMDPEKYQDARLHRDHLRPLAGSADRFVFLLNQVDRLPAGTVDQVVEDLRRSLVADGMPASTIVAAAGDPPSGQPLGLDDLLAAIRGLGSTGRVVIRRVIDELTAAADRLVDSLGGAGGTGFSTGWATARDEVARGVAAAVDADLEHEAARVASRDAAVVTSWVGGRRVADVIAASSARVPAGTSEPIRRLVDRIAAGLDRDTRVALVETADMIEPEVAAAAVTVGATTTVALPSPPGWWSAVRLLSYVLGAIVLGGVALVVDAVRSGGEMAPGFVAAAGAVGSIVGLRLAVRRSAGARVQAALADRRAATEDLVAVELERRLGRPLREILRARSAPGAAHVELMLGVRRHEERES